MTKAVEVVGINSATFMKLKLLENFLCQVIPPVLVYKNAIGVLLDETRSVLELEPPIKYLSFTES